MMDGLVRGPFSTHDIFVHESIFQLLFTNYDAQHPKLTVIALINHRIFLYSLNWMKCMQQPKSFSKKSPLHECMIGVQSEIIKFHENHKCWRGNCNYECMILLPRIQLTRLWLATFTTHEYKLVTIRWNSFIN